MSKRGKEEERERECEISCIVVYLQTCLKKVCRRQRESPGLSLLFNSLEKVLDGLKVTECLHARVLVRKVIEDLVLGLALEIHEHN